MPPPTRKSDPHWLQILVWVLIAIVSLLAIIDRIIDVAKHIHVTIQ